MNTSNLSIGSILNKQTLSNVYFILFIGLIARIIVSFSLIGGLHADEQFQGLEMAYNLLYPSSKNIIPWEFATQTRSYIIPFLFVPIVYVSSIIHVVGLPYFTLLRFSLSLVSLSFIPLAKHLFKGETPYSEGVSSIVSWFCALYLPLIFFSNYLGADGLALLFLMFLMFYISKEQEQEFSNSKYFLIGVSMSLLITLRLQFAIIFIPFILKVLTKKQYYAIYGFLIGSTPLIVVDYLFYGFPGITVVNFFQFNVITQKNVALVPQSYWWLYIVIVPLLLLYLGLGIPIIAFNYTKGYSYSKNASLRLLALGSLLYIVFFQYLTYKEVRFLIPAITILLFDSFQSLPLFLQKVQQMRHQNIVKVYAIIVLLTIPISFIIAPYNYDLKDNLWLAQSKIQQLDPGASIGIIDPFQMSGGYFFQYGGKTSATIYFMDQMDNTQLNETFHKITYFINDQNHKNYSSITQLKDSICSSNILIKEYTSVRQFSLDRLNYYFNPDKLGIKIDLWKCN